MAALPPRLKRAAQAARDPPERQPPVRAARAPQGGHDRIRAGAHAGLDLQGRGARRHAPLDRPPGVGAGRHRGGGPLTCRGPAHRVVAGCRVEGPQPPPCRGVGRAGWPWALPCGRVPPSPPAWGRRKRHFAARWPRSLATRLAGGQAEARPGQPVPAAHRRRASHGEARVVDAAPLARGHRLAAGVSGRQEATGVRRAGHARRRGRPWWSPPPVGGGVQPMGRTPARRTGASDCASGSGSRCEGGGPRTPQALWASAVPRGPGGAYQGPRLEASWGSKVVTTTACSQQPRRFAPCLVSWLDFVQNMRFE
jgi:hypothetical protein